MPLHDTPPDAVDKVYAQSLFEKVEAAGGQARLEEMVAELDELVELMRSEAQLSEFFASKIIPMDEREKSLRGIFEGRVSDVLLHFVLVLNRKERLNRFLSMAASFSQMVQERFGRVEVDVYTRHPVPREQIDSIRERLQAALKREPVVYAYTDEGMIGGIKLQVGDQLIDGSVATQLRRMRDLLSSEGAAVLRTKFESAFEEEA